MQDLETSSKVAIGTADARAQRGGLIDESAHAEDPRWQLALRIVASDGLRRSRLLQDFLLYVVDRELSGRADDITEQQIGVRVFGRQEGYDSNEDNIVRSYARTLRRRVEEYFTEKGHDEKLRLEIPRGGYAPVFYPITAQLESEPSNISSHLAEAAFSPPAEPLQNLPARPRTIRPIRGMAIALGLGILIGIAGAYLALRSKKALSPQAALAHLLWSQIFSSDRDTFLVPSDDGLVIMQGLLPRPLPLAQYVSGRYRLDADIHAMPGGERLFVLGARRFTSVVDVDLIAHLSQLNEVAHGRLMVRYARDLRMDDLRTANAVLIGANESNPWVDLFQQRLPLRFCFDCGPEKRQVIFNAHPRSGENSIYVNSGDDNTYGIIAFVPNLAASGNVLMVAGLNMAGTQAAASFLLDQKLMMPILQRAKTANGALQPFEILVYAGNIATNASTPRAVVERIGLVQ